MTRIRRTRRSFPGPARAVWVLALACAAPAGAQEEPPAPLRDPTPGQVGRPGSDLAPIERPQQGEQQRRIAQAEGILLEQIRLIEDPAERALALQNAAGAFLAADRFDPALEVLRESAEVARAVTDTTLHDVRLAGTARRAVLLFEELSRQATEGARYRFANDPRPSRPPAQRLEFLDQAREAMSLAASAAASIRRENERSAELSRIARVQARSGQGIRRLVVALEVDDRTADTFRQRASGSLIAAQETAWRIPIPIWRDDTLVEVANAAAMADEFDSALEIARSIPQAQARADALIRVAEAQARDRLDSQATDTYQEAVIAVASIPMPSPRRTFAAVLIDSLIAVGRFEDARAAARLIPDPAFRLQALAAVARSMGERGLSDAAFRWIEAEVPAADRGRLRQAVASGVMEWVEGGRTTRGAQLPRGTLTPEQLNRLLNPPEARER